MFTTPSVRLCIIFLIRIFFSQTYFNVKMYECFQCNAVWRTSYIFEQYVICTFIITVNCLLLSVFKQVHRNFFSGVYGARNRRDVCSRSSAVRSTRAPLDVAIRYAWHTTILVKPNKQIVAFKNSILFCVNKDDKKRWFVI